MYPRDGGGLSGVRNSLARRATNWRICASAACVANAVETCSEAALYGVREDVEITAARERDRLRAEVARGETLQGFGDIDQRLNRLLRDEPADEYATSPTAISAQQHLR